MNVRKLKQILADVDDDIVIATYDEGWLQTEFSGAELVTEQPDHRMEKNVKVPYFKIW